MLRLKGSSREAQAGQEETFLERENGLTLNRLPGETEAGNAPNLSGFEVTFSCYDNYTS